MSVIAIPVKIMRSIRELEQCGCPILAMADSTTVKYVSHSNVPVTYHPWLGRGGALVIFNKILNNLAATSQSNLIPPRQ